jgi:hypothetical protein
MRTDPTAEEQVRAFARSCVRAGLSSSEQMHAELVEAITKDLPDRADEADELATVWLDEAHDELRGDQQEWPESTDYERLQSAFAEMELLDVSVLQGCEDHWAAKRLIEDSLAGGAGLRGVAWFTPSDVWHAVDEGMLEVNLWHGTTANAAPGDELLDDVLGILEKHGLSARFDEGRIEVDAHWYKRIAHE